MKRNETLEIVISIFLVGCLGGFLSLIYYIPVHHYVSLPIDVACEHHDYLTNTSDSVNIDYITNFKASPPEDCCGKRPKEICVFEYTAQSFNPVGVIENFLGDIEYYEIKGKPRGEKVKIQ